MNEGDIKEEVSQRVYDIADEVDWAHLTIPQRQKYYEAWTTDPEIGGKLSQVMDQTRIRVYLKDTVMKNYSRDKRPKLQSLITSMSLPCVRVTQEFIKPQAVLCDGNKLYTVAAAKEWKIALLSAFERGCEVRNLRENVVFFIEHTTGRFVDREYRDLIDSAAKRLEVKVFWLT